MTSRVVVLRDLGGVLHIIPDRSVNIVRNRTRGFSRTVVHVGVAYSEQIDNVIAVLRDVDRVLREDADWQPQLVEQPKVLGVDALADSSVNVRGVATTLPGRPVDVGRELRRRITNRFDQEGVTIPLPQRTLHLGDAEALQER